MFAIRHIRVRLNTFHMIIQELTDDIYQTGNKALILGCTIYLIETPYIKFFVEYIKNIEKV